MTTIAAALINIDIWRVELARARGDLGAALFLLDEANADIARLQATIAQLRGDAEELRVQLSWQAAIR